MHQSPVTFSSVDVACLLQRVEQLCVEMGALKHITMRQADVCEQVWTRVVGIDQCVTLLESQSGASAAAVALNSQGLGVMSQPESFPEATGERHCEWA